MKRRTFLSAAAGSSLVACAPGTHLEPDAKPSATVANPELEALGSITLTVWDQEVLGGQNDQIEALNTQFQAAYPHITIRRVNQNADDLRKQVALSLPGDEVPDVVQIHSSRADMGVYVRAGLLTDLTELAGTHGWEQRFPASLLATSRYSADAVTFGEGNLYGLPQTGEIVGFYYRQTTLDKLGGEVPGTWEGVFELFGAARSRDMQLMALGNLNGRPALHLLGVLQGAFVPTDDIVKLASGHGGASWLNDGNIEALTLLASWAAEGYFGEAPNAIDGQGAVQHFVDGKSAFLPAGSWLAADLHDAVGDGLRFMPPPAGVDGGLASPGGAGPSWAIPAKAANPEAAAAYLDFISSEDAMVTIAGNRDVPALRTAELAPEVGVRHDVFHAFATHAAADGLLPYLEYATPTFGDTAAVELQHLIGGQQEPRAVAIALEADYRDFIS